MVRTECVAAAGQAPYSGMPECRANGPRAWWRTARACDDGIHFRPGEVDVAMKAPFGGRQPRAQGSPSSVTGTMSSGPSRRRAIRGRHGEAFDPSVRQRALTLPDLPRLIPRAFIASASTTAERNACSSVPEGSLMPLGARAFPRGIRALGRPGALMCSLALRAFPREEQFALGQPGASWLTFGFTRSGNIAAIPDRVAGATHALGEDRRRAAPA